jgi:acyl transferase domain-containing protein
MTGEWLDGPEAGAEYWFDSLRSPVEFDRAVRVLAGAGHRVFIEMSPHPVLTAAITETLDDVAAAPAVVTGTLRRADGGAARFLTSLAEVYVRGVAVEWAAVLGGGRRVELPTYAFQHQRFWPQPARQAAGDVAAAGLWAVDHPLLGAAVELAGGDGYVLTGRLSVRSHPWLADHVVAGMVLLPATAFVELALRVGDAAGCSRIQDLTLEAPLVLPGDGPVHIQVTVGGQGLSGGREIGMYSRPQETEAGAPWTRHASGLLVPARPPGTDSAEAAPARAGDFSGWPPEGAIPVTVEDFYDGPAASGYGPAFRGLRKAWRRGEEIFAEVCLPEDAAADARAFGLHPALLDAALQAAGLAAAAGPSDGRAADPATVRMPFAFADVSLHAAGASALRVRLRRELDGALSLAAADAAGAPVVSVGSLVTRPVSAGRRMPCSAWNGSRFRPAAPSRARGRWPVLTSWSWRQD